MRRLWILFLLLTPILAEARHIIGGSITYRFIGNGDYEFTLKIYRDCNSPGGALLDPLASIGIYQCPEGGCVNLTQANVFAQLRVPLGSRRNVAQPNYPCLIPPDVCVEEGIYTFKLSSYGIRLPLSNASYHISYQRCCRNRTISNLVDPLTLGATYTVEITPEAQRLGNSSPTFNNFPPTVICADALLNYDHRAVDPDGDILQYELCAPLDGGGMITEGQVFSCLGASPTPACPPPYNRVPFLSPLYSATSPLPGTPNFSIDPNTGMITGKPNLIGQFVVGVCVSEYRNGVLLSRVFRDFQFNVASCDPKLVADIKEDVKLADRNYEINACGRTEIKFINESFPRSFISVYKWEFGIKGKNQVFTDWEPTITFPGIGKYKGQLLLNPGTECGDTADITVNIYPDLKADFVYQYDTCKAGPVKFTDKSVSGGKYITNWKWDFGDGKTGTIQNPVHTYRSAGKIPVSLTVRDTNRCVETVSKVLSYFPVPALIVIAPSTFDGCVPDNVKFTNLSFPIDSTYKINWNFGDGGKSKEISPIHRYTSPGLFTVTVDITSPIGCSTDTLFNNLIRMRPTPTAGFTFSPEKPSTIEPKVTFLDQSIDATSIFWKFSNGQTFRDRTFSYIFQDTGRVKVEQLVINNVGCRDSIFKIIDIVPEIRYFIPNAFTPNADAVNDEFRGVGIMDGARNFNMGIWNRWGELVFQTKNPFEGWNGRKFNTGQDAPNGVYVVLVNYLGPRGEPNEIRGFVTLLR
jgi:gliding motility-associated-like protein